jgi:hypothetical protein
MDQSLVWDGGPPPRLAPLADPPPILGEGCKGPRRMGLAPCAAASHHPTDRSLRRETSCVCCSEFIRPCRGKGYHTAAITSISTATSRGRRAACTVERAGLWSPKARP